MSGRRTNQNSAGVNTSKMETSTSRNRTWKVYIGSKVSPKQLEKGDCCNGEREDMAGQWNRKTQSRKSK